MDYLYELGGLGLGSRLKRLSDRLGQEVTKIYKEEGIDFEPRWFPVFRFIADSGSMAITDIALAVGITHPAVNQIAQELSESGLITASSDKNDKRKRLLSLSVKGKRVHTSIQSTWKAIHASVSDLMAETHSNLLNALGDFEHALDRNSLCFRLQELAPMLENSKLEIVDYAPELKNHFVRISRVWLEKYFSVSELVDSDWKLFSNPGKIIEDGGAIFFAKLGNRIVGTCALMKHNPSLFSIEKLGVDEAYQGRKIGLELLNACIETAKKHKAKTIRLDTHTSLKSALTLYRKLGFEPVADSNLPKSKYPSSRVNLVMELKL